MPDLTFAYKTEYRKFNLSQTLYTIKTYIGNFVIEDVLRNEIVPV